MHQRQGNVFMIIAPSGAGKSSLVNALLSQDSDIILSISCTTRSPRPGEIHGREYFFVSMDNFQEMQKNNELLEWAEVHDNFYGTPKHYIDQATQAGKDVLLEIDWQGARQVRKHFPKIIDIFILPPSFDELEARLNRRGTDEPKVISRRLMAAGNEMAHASECEYVIINKDFNLALQELQQVVNVARLRFKSQSIRNDALFRDLGISSS